MAGGGPAGLMAAGQAAGAGADVMVLEKMKQPGRKLCITGKGRCNITNTADIENFIGHFGKTGQFMHQSFARFFSNDLAAFLEDQGLELVTERGGRVFPASGKAPDVLNCLLKWTRNQGVKIITKVRISKLNISKGQITGVTADKQKYECDALILATGGKSYPATGSSGDGYHLAESAGHSIVQVRPALVPLETPGKTASRMDGLSLRNINAKLLINGKVTREEFGELAFTGFGLTGPVVLTMSGNAVDALREKKKVQLEIDLKPGLNPEKLDARLLRDFSSRTAEPMHSVLRGLLPREMVPVCLDSIAIPRQRKASSVTAGERKRLHAWLKKFRIDISGYRPFKEAIITAGGISTKEINPQTMESRLVKRLFFAGEILDIQADTGGYNLQAAFSTGWLAGQTAALQQNHT